MIDLYLLRNAIKDLTRPRKLLAALVLILVPSLLALVMRYVIKDNYNAQNLYNLMAQKVVFGFVMVMLAVVFCTSVVAQEIEDKTIVYLLTRPLPRWRILTMKFLPALLVTLLTVWLTLLLLALVTEGVMGLKAIPLAHDLAMTPIGVLAYGSVFLLLGTLLDRPLIYGLLYAFGWESWTPFLPGSFMKLSLMAYMRVLAPHTLPVQENVDLTQAITSISQDSITVHLAWIVLLGVTIVSFTGALFAFSKREYVPRDTE